MSFIVLGIPTYNPRLISIGLQGSLGSLSSTGSLYTSDPDPSDIITWSGNVSRYASEPQQKNLFLQTLYEEQTGPSAVSNDADVVSPTLQREVHDKDRVECLEKGVQYWTDFSKVQYHPRSLYELHSSWTDVKQFDNYGTGKDVLSEGLQGEEMNERMRLFVEECDHVQGIQFILDDSGGFSGVAAEYLENIADEYTNTPVLLYTVRDPHAYIHAKSQKDSITRSLHDAVSFSTLSSYCKLMVPIGLPSLSRSKLSSTLHVEDQKLFHCSAVYAAALHSISIPFRMDMRGPTVNTAYVSGAVDVGGIIQMLAGQGRQNMVATLDVAMPAPSLTGSILRSLNSLTPEVEEDVDDSQALESLITHGMLHAGRRASLSEVNDSIVAAYDCEMSKPKFSHASVSLCPLPIPLPFPSIFRSCVGRQGELLETPTEMTQTKGSLDIDSIPMAARLRSSRAVMPLIMKRLENLRKFGMQRGALGGGLLQNWGFGREEIEDMGEVMAKMVMQLDPHSQGSSGSDWD
ncbi:protein misato homolog 1 isoform X2 [Asparagus officinalis]|uniref:protein misato homolog 1 isoform X2 n=1 Tax=Asparagus officinalis TaxID=4686 RepID=UPI00098E2F90|nr:protein misato homolog 1 isoform X2 [Asparagus officinalis]